MKKQNRLRREKNYIGASSRVCCILHTWAFKLQGATSFLGSRTQQHSTDGIFWNCDEHSPPPNQAFFSSHLSVLGRLFVCALQIEYPLTVERGSSRRPSLGTFLVPGSEVMAHCAPAGPALGNTVCAYRPCAVVCLPRRRSGHLVVVGLRSLMHCVASRQRTVAWLHDWFWLS